MAAERAERAVERPRRVVGHERERGSELAVAAVSVEPRPGREQREARVRLGMVADAVREHVEAVGDGRALARDRRLVRVAALGDVLRRIRGRRGRDRLRVRHRGEQDTALVERDRVRVDDPDLLERRPGPADELVVDRQHRLADDRERRVVEQVVRLRDRTGERALDREHAVLDLARGDRLRDGAEARQRQRLGALGEEALARGGAVGSFAAGIGDLDLVHHAFLKMGGRFPPRVRICLAGEGGRAVRRLARKGARAEKLEREEEAGLVRARHQALRVGAARG